MSAPQVGEWLRSRRMSLLLTQEELARRAGVSVRTVQNLEAGTAGTPRPTTLRQLAEVLGPIPELGAPRRGGPAPAELPADVAAFTGRTAELAELDRLTAAREPGGLAIAVVSGGGGVGKTALVVHWAHRMLDAFDDGQLYVNLRGYDARQPLATGDVLTRFLVALGAGEGEVPLDEEERAARYRTATAGRRMLILLDNAASAEQVRPLLPGTASCVVLVTSRESLSGLVSMHGARRLRLDRLPMAESLALLRRLLPSRVESEPEAAVTLAEQCARLPLALRLAADLATSRPGTTLAGLVGELSNHRRLDLLDAGGDTRAALRAVFSWSYRNLPPVAAAAFRTVGLHPGPDLDSYAAAALLDADADRARRLLDRLARCHLVERTASGRYGMHDLLRSYAAELAAAQDPEVDRRAALTRLYDHYLATAGAAAEIAFPHRLTGSRTTEPPVPGPLLADRSAALGWLDAQRATLSEVCAHTARHGWPVHTVRLAGALFHYHYHCGHLADMQAVQVHALRAARQVGDRSGEAYVLTNLAAAAGRLSGYRQALEYLQRALAIFRELGDSYGIGLASGVLAVTHVGLGRYAAARDHCQQAVGRFRRLGDRLGEARARTILAEVHARCARYKPATDQCRRALAQYRELGQEAATRHAYLAFGIVESRRGRYESAAGHFRRALAISETSGSWHEQVQALNGLGEAERGAGRSAAAVGHHRRALDIATRSGDRDEQARAHAGLGHAYCELGERGMARKHWRQAVAGYAGLGSPMADVVQARLAGT